MRSRFRFLAMLALASLGSVFTLQGASPDFCALRVKISSWDGDAINFTTIELVNPSGQIELRQTVKSEFQVCDFGFGPHTLRVGTNECFPIAVSNLEVKLGNPILLDLKMPKCAYGRPMYGSFTGERACFAYFRTTMADGEPLSQVEFSPRLGIDAPRTDSYGRWQGIIAGTKEITFSRTGYAPKKLRIGCPDVGPLEVGISLTALN